MGLKLNIMPRQFILAQAVASFSLISNGAMAKVFHIDTYITDQAGCKFHVTGTADAGLFGVNSYTLDGGDCGGYHHFQGDVTGNPSGGVTIVKGTLKNLNTGKDEDFNAAPLLSSIRVQL